jgi:hypothetical protein
VTELERMAQGAIDVDGYKGEDGDDANIGDQDDASQADDRSTQKVEDSRKSGFDLGTSDVDEI